MQCTAIIISVKCRFTDLRLRYFFSKAIVCRYSFKRGGSKESSQSMFEQNLENMLPTYVGPSLTIQNETSKPPV